MSGIDRRRKGIGVLRTEIANSTISGREASDCDGLQGIFTDYQV